MITRENTFIDLTDLMNEDNNKNNKKCFKYKMPKFFIYLLKLVIPLGLMIGLIVLIHFLI